MACCCSSVRAHHGLTLSLLRLLFHSAAPQAGPAGLVLLPSQVLDFALAEFHTIPAEAGSEVLLDTSPTVQCMGCFSCLNASANLIKALYHLFWIIAEDRALCTFSLPPQNV